MRTGAQLPRIEVAPPGVGNKAAEIVAIAKVAGLFLDPWQRHIIEVGTTYRADGKFSAFEVGLEVPRQNGKSAALEALILWHLFLSPETKTIIYSAHEFKAAKQIFRRLEKLIEDTPALAAQLKPSGKSNGILHGSDDLSITLRDGSVVRFLARSAGSGRAFTGDLIILDEAYKLASDMIAAIVPTMAARSVDGNPQIWYTSSAGMIDSTVLNGTRDRALGEDPGRLAWMEWSVPRKTPTGDIEARYTANPALGIRISLEYLADELRSFLNDPELGEDAWRRERLGIREETSAEAVINLDSWRALADRYSQMGNVLAFAVDVPPDRTSATISAASFKANGDVQIEVVDRRAGTSWAAPRAKELQDRWKPVQFVLDEGSAAGALKDDFKKAGVKTKPLTMREYANACGRVFDMIHRDTTDGPELTDDASIRLAHIGQEELDDAVAAAKKRPLGDSAWVWSRKNVLADISPLVGCTHALVGLLRKGRRPGQPHNAGKSRVIVL